MLEANSQALDIASLVRAEKKRTARKLLATLRDEKNLRTHFALGDACGTYISVEKSGQLTKAIPEETQLEPLFAVENQLKVKRNGLNKSLRKVSQIKKALGFSAGLNAARSDETTAMAEKLYAMADELQSLLAM